MRRVRAMPVFDSEMVDLDAPWRAEAACRAEFLQDPLAALMWDTTDRSSLAFKRASEICKTCPVRDLCVPDAVADSTSNGVRGGFGFHKGTVLATDAERIKNEFGLTAARRASGVVLAEAG